MAIVFAQGAPDPLDAKARPIVFTLHDTSAGKGQKTSLELFVRPEDLSITWPSRMAVSQTFGEDGAWADSFGEGVKTIALNGTTGWRGARTGPNGGDDGYQHFEKLHKTVFTEWHKLREAAAKAGNNPDKVMLILSEGLDKLSWVVAPQNFVLKRNKSRPLLAQYAITMHRVADDMRELEAKMPSTEEQKAAAISSLQNTLKDIQNFATKLKTMVSSVLGPVKAAIGNFVGMVSSICKAVIGAVKSVTGVIKGVVGELVGMAQNISRAGMNIAQAVAAITTLPQQIKAEFQKLSSAFTTMTCILRNVFKKRVYLPDYNIYGSGSCASTSGGMGISKYVSENTFASVMRTDNSTVAVTSGGAAAISYGMNMDPTTATAADAGNTASAIYEGVRIDSSAAASTSTSGSSKAQRLEPMNFDASYPGKGDGAPAPDGWTGGASSA